jgi:VanZ family protein
MHKFTSKLLNAQLIMKNRLKKNLKIKPLSVIWATMILLLSLLSLQNIEKEKLEFIPHLDKLVHFTMYMLLSFLIAIEYFKNSSKLLCRLIIPVAIAILYGGILEILQRLSSYRSTDIFDFVFNVLGAVMGIIIFMILTKMNKALKLMTKF